MKILFVNHTSRMSGGERSLHDVLAALPDHVEPAVATPEGAFAGAVRALGIPVLPLPAAEGSLRLHPVNTPAAVASIARAAAATRRAAERFGADLLHANSIRAGVIAALAHRLGAPPAIVYVRDVLPPGAVSSASLRVMASGAVALVPNSHHTASALPADGDVTIRVLHSPLDLRRFDPASTDRAAARARLRLEPDDVALVLVAQLTPWKAQDDAIRILSRVRDGHPEARLLLVGSAKFLDKATRYDNDAYRAWLGKLSCALGLQDEVRFLGEREDVPDILAASDVALLPSWEEPFGRSVAEAMAMRLPVVATSVGGPAEIVRDGEDGLLLPPRRPAEWAEAVGGLVADPERRREMGERGRRHVCATFAVQRHVEGLLDVYASAG